MTKPRIIAFDLETSNLNANFGYILCMGWKVIGESKVNIIKISDFDIFKKDPTNDKEVAKAGRDVLKDADGWLTWFGQYFDVPFLDTRLLSHGLSTLPYMTPSTHIDGWRIAKRRLKLNSNRLASVSQFLGVEEKTPIKGTHWIKAMAGNMKSLRYVYEHCKQDVIVLEQVYDKLMPLCNWHFNVNLIDGKLSGCPRCGSDKLQKRGWAYAQVNRKRRYFCKDCGAWSLGKVETFRGVKHRAA